MFAGTRVAGIIVAGATVFLTPGCQDPNGLQSSGANQQSRRPTTLNHQAKDYGKAEPPARIHASTYIAAARLHESQGHLLEAIQQYQFALKEDSKNAEILGQIGVVYDRIGNGAEAEGAYKRALQIAPNDAHLHNNLAFSYIMHKKWPQAEAELNRALALSPEFARARVNLAMVLAQSDRFDESLKQFKQVLPAEDAHYNLGLMYQSKRKMVEAAEQYKIALQANPKLVAAREQLKRLPSTVLSQADRGLAADRPATEVAEKTMVEVAPDAGPSPECVPDEAPTARSASTTSQPSSANESAAPGPAALLGEMSMANDLAWAPADLTPVLVSLLAKNKPVAATGSRAPARTHPTTRPAQGAAIMPSNVTLPVPAARIYPGPTPTVSAGQCEMPNVLGAGMVTQLDSVLPPWQRSPELIVELSTDSSWATSTFADRWLSCAESPAPHAAYRAVKTVPMAAPQPSTRPY